MHTRSPRAAILCLTLGAMLISLSGVWVKTAQVSAATSAFYRVFLGGSMLLVLSMWRGELKGVTRPQILNGLLAGLLFAVDLFLYHKSVLQVGPGLGTILPNFQVFILAAVGFVFLGEKVRTAYVLSVPFAFTGLFMIVGFDFSSMSPEYVSGIWFGFGAAVVYSLFTLTLRRTQSLAKNNARFSTMAVVSLAAASFLGLESYAGQNSLAITNLTALLSLTALALCSQVLGWSLIATTLPSVKASVAGIILLLQPALAFVWDFIFFGRPTTTVNWLGLGIVLAAIYGGSVKRPGQQVPDPAPALISQPKSSIQADKSSQQR
jgi:drug/metabolite transporter (DMT)-like permease